MKNLLNVLFVELALINVPVVSRFLIELLDEMRREESKLLNKRGEALVPV